MPNFRRFYIPNSIIFITCVTKDRARIFLDTRNVQLFMDTLKAVQVIHPFHLLAYVILPDHFHWLMLIDSENGNFSKVLHSVKRNFTLQYKETHDIKYPLSLWQPRFWDHVIRDEDDLRRHFDYIHWNPIKHGYVDQPDKWLYSTFNHWYGLAYYDAGWGKEKEPQEIRGMDFE